MFYLLLVRKDRHDIVAVASLFLAIDDPRVLAGTTEDRVW